MTPDALLESLLRSSDVCVDVDENDESDVLGSLSSFLSSYAVNEEDVIDNNTNGDNSSDDEKRRRHRRAVCQCEFAHCAIGVRKTGRLEFCLSFLLFFRFYVVANVQDNVVLLLCFQGIPTTALNRLLKILNLGGTCVPASAFLLRKFEEKVLRSSMPQERICRWPSNVTDQRQVAFRQIEAVVTQLLNEIGRLRSFTTKIR